MAMMPGQPRDPFPEALGDPAVAATRRKRLMRLLAGAAVIVGAAAVVPLSMTPEARRTYVIAVCVGFILCGTLPMLATFLQFLAVGLHRFRIGYEELAPYFPRVAVVVPAWNEADVIGTTIERLLAMDYPQDRLRIYVVDDASTDATAEVVRGWEARVPDRVRYLHREHGGQGKAHTLNYGLAQILADPWAEAVLVMDADVLFEDSALRRMARHLSRPDVGAVTAYIKEGSANGNYLTRFIGYEYIAAQAASRRAQNVFGAMACLAGGAQLHSRENLEDIGGRIDTSSLAEDTVTTFYTQLSGKSVVFEGNAIVWAEEPGDLVGLWKQRLRWARGNVQISLQFSTMWLRGRRYSALGGGLFAFVWFSVVLMPVLTIAASGGLLGLYAMDARLSWELGQALWTLQAVVYAFVTAMSWALDPSTARRTWRQGLLFPGVISLGIIIYSLAPGPMGLLLVRVLEGAGIEVTDRLVQAARLFVYTWLAGSLLAAYAAKWIAARWQLVVLPRVLLEIAGYGGFLCCVALAAYVREIQGAALTWDKTLKSGKVVMLR